MKICIVTSCGGHLTEARALMPAYSNEAHFYVIDDDALLPDDMVGRTYFITHSERDWRVLVTFWEALAILRRERPTAILSTGAGCAVPFGIIGRLLFGARVVFVETMTRVEKPSLAGRIMYWIAHDFYYQWPSTQKILPKGALWRPADMSTFVSVGNAHQPFTRLLAAIAANSMKLPQPVVVQRGHTPFKSGECQSRPFFEMSEFEELIAQSHLVIVQAGGGGVLHALRSGKIPVLVPRRGTLGEHIDDHQVTWGRALASSRRAVLVEDVSQLMEGVQEALIRQKSHKAQPIEIPLIDLVRDALRRSA